MWYDKNKVWMCMHENICLLYFRRRVPRKGLIIFGDPCHKMYEYPLFKIHSTVLIFFLCCLWCFNLSDVTRILSSLEELKRSSFSLKYSSMHCSSKSCTFFSSSSVIKSSVGGRVFFVTVTFSHYISEVQVFSV